MITFKNAAIKVDGKSVVIYMDIKYYPLGKGFIPLAGGVIEHHNNEVFGKVYTIYSNKILYGSCPVLQGWVWYYNQKENFLKTFCELSFNRVIKKARRFPQFWEYDEYEVYIPKNMEYIRKKEVDDFKMTCIMGYNLTLYRGVDPQ